MKKIPEFLFMKNISLICLGLLILAACHTNSKDAKLKEKQSFNDPYIKNIPDSFKYLARRLDTVYENDQKYRSLTNPALYSDHIYSQSKLDSVNLKTVTSILDKYNWLGVYNVGLKGSMAMEMVMVHADSSTKIKYYPNMFTSLVKGRISFGNYALFEDKLNVQTGRYQYYGSQVRYESNSKVLVLPVFEPDSLDIRRKKMHLEPMAQYLKRNFNAQWDLEEYKKKLPDLLKMFPIKDSKSFHTNDENHKLN